jgi:hypothetical protein
VRPQTQQPVAKPVPTAKPASPRHRASRPSKQADVGSLEWQRTLHPKVRQFLDAAGKLDWSGLP